MAKELFKVDLASIKPYFSGNKKHKNYFKTRDIYWHNAFHADGFFLHTPTADERSTIQGQDTDTKDTNPYFQRLIDQRRPSESDSILAYRRVVYRPLTQGVWFKVYNSLLKIVRSEDFRIDYAKADLPSSVPDDEYLEDYCEEKYPTFDSVENWFASYGMKQMLVDPNGLVYVLPKTFEIEENQLYEPIAITVLSKDVYEYKENELAIFRVDRTYEYTTEGGKIKRKGIILGILTREGYWEAKQINSKMDFDIEEVSLFPEEMKYLPAWCLGGVQKKIAQDYILYDSFMAPMLPALDEMAADTSELSAEKIQHIYSTMWYYSMSDCRTCMGSGKVNVKGKQSITCSVCNGTGGAPKSPYRDIVVKPDALNGDKLPLPPAGYVTKSTDMVKMQLEILDREELMALSSVNHEFLSRTPIAQSGISKQYDQQELENFTSGVAKRMTVIMRNVYYFINEFRYMLLVPNEIERIKMLPVIPVPTKYSLITVEVLEAQMKAAMEAKSDPEIIDQLEMEYIAKKFPNEHNLRNIMRVKKRLDPFPRLTTQEKQDIVLSKNADPVDVLVSIYLHPFIEQAFIDYPEDTEGKQGFCELDFDKQKEVIYKYAQDKMTKLDDAQKVKDDAKMKQLKAMGGIDPKTGKPAKGVPPIE